ncbi:MAG TPA: ferric reductase-like transmembrane domain-containing protein, partial [Stellaceae bacterium]|nr:ferric reductase-like transmembrane domain-containing protein [Stellaceae bacterium]
IIHVAGLWGIRLLYLSLAVTPLRETLRWPRLFLVRRMIGVGAFCYLAVHLAFYTADQGFDLAHVAAEIVRRIYLTIGFSALCIVSALAATSTDGAVRRLGGRRWQHLHRLVYLAGILATIHYFMQSKQDVTEATVMGGLYAWLMLYRILRRVRTRDIPPPWQLALLAMTATLLTFGGEATYYWAKLGVDPLRVLAADFSLKAGIRPGWFVFAITAAIPVAAVLRAVIWRAPARQAAS